MREDLLSGAGADEVGGAVEGAIWTGWGQAGTGRTGWAAGDCARRDCNSVSKAVSRAGVSVSVVEVELGMRA